MNGTDQPLAPPSIHANCRDQVPPERGKQTLRAHLERNIQFYGEVDGQRLFRKHAIQYLMLRNLDRETRKRILQPRPSGEFLALVNEMYAVAE